jgi:hypothetical protein
MHESTRTVNTTNNMGHTGLVTTKSGQMGLFRGVIPGERADATTVVLGTLLGQETQTSVTGSFELTMRPDKGNENENVSKR